jgi:hypothetical protein
MASDKAINKFLDAYDPEVQAIAHELCRIINDRAPKLVEEVKSGWKNITYTGDSIVCAVAPYTAYVSLHFYKGTELDDPENLLEGGGKALRHIKFHDLDAVNEKTIAPFIKQAVALDSA